MTDLRVLVVDNDPIACDNLLEMLQPEGYVVRVVPGTGAKLIASARACGRQFRPHIAIVDLRLQNDRNTADVSGLKLLTTLRSAHGILYSSYLSHELSRRIAQTSAIAWISKGESPQNLLEQVRRNARQDGFRCRSPQFRSLTEKDIMHALFGRDANLPLDLVRTVVRRLFPQGRRIALLPLAENSTIAPAASRRHSVVLRAHVDDWEPVVVKLAPARQIRTEFTNYQKVNGRLGGRFRAEIYRTAEFWELGGAAYSFLGSSVEALPSFHAFYSQQESPECILKPLGHFFGQVWARFYDRSRPCRRHTPLVQRYDHVFHLKKHLNRLDTCQEMLSIPGLPCTLVNPVLWVLQHADESLFQNMRLAITHGDLHGQNLFVDGEHSWTIDFERTGSGHRLRDFIELELDISTRLTPFLDADPLPFFRLAVSLAALSNPESPESPLLVDDSYARKALLTIAGLRRLAYYSTHYEDAREYLWGLLLNAVFVAALAGEQSPQGRRALILASVLCERLQRWGQEWPPTGWLSVQ